MKTLFYFAPKVKQMLAGHPFGMRIKDNTIRTKTPLSIPESPHVGFLYFYH